MSLALNSVPYFPEFFYVLLYAEGIGVHKVGIPVHYRDVSKDYGIERLDENLSEPDVCIYEIV